MTDSATTALGFINRGIAAYRNEQPDQARAHFVQALLADSGNELAWIWFATVTTDRGEQRYAINRALAINPESASGGRLDRLAGVTPHVPNELAELDRPGLPPDLVKPSGGARLPVALPLPRINRSRRSSTLAAGDDVPEPTAEAEPEGELEGNVKPVERSPKRGVTIWQWGAGGLALLVIGGLLFTWLRPEPESYRIAIVAPLSGPLASTGEEQVRAAELAVDQINDDGGINGRDLSLVVFDDANDADIAVERAEEIASDDRILLVIGHNDSNASLAAAPTYAEAGIPAISPSAAADQITADNESYFSVVLPTSDQASYMAAYAQSALGMSRASMVGTSGIYSTAVRKSFTADFEELGGMIEGNWQIDLERQDQSVAGIVNELAATEDPGILVLAMLQPEARTFILAARRAGIEAPMMVSPSLGFDDFPDLFEEEPEEVETPGFFTNGIYAASPLIFDSIGGSAVTFADAYRERYGTSPDWFAAKVHDAITVGSAAIERAEIEPVNDVSANRTSLTNALSAIDSPDTAVPGLGTPLFFSDQGFVPQSLSIGRFDTGNIGSEPIQYTLVTDPALYDLEADRAANRILAVSNNTFRQYRVAYIGLGINEISNLNTASQTFTADFFLWFRYTGDATASEILFTNAMDPSLSVGDPMQLTESEAETYVMYRVHGEFSQPLDFHDYPWDTHNLRIGFENLTLNNDDIIYVADPSILDQSQEERLLSGADQSRPFNTIPNWEATRVWYSQETQLSRSVLQDEDTLAPGYVEFSEFQVDMTFGRDVTSFLVKNLLPLTLLALITYISLFFSPEQAGSRTGFAITSILTSFVLLGAISATLPDIGYTVAIEWGFYVYIGLSAVLVLFNIIVDRLYKQKRFSVVRRLDIAARILYPSVFVAMIVLYAMRFT